MFTFGDHCDEFRSRFPRVPPLEAKAFVWQAIKDLFNDHPWSFAVKSGSVISEAAYNTGTVSVTNGSASVAMSGGTWSNGWTTAPSSRRFVGQGRNENYGITISGSNGTLDAPWQGDTNAAATYTLYRDVYSLPTDCDFGKVAFLIYPATYFFIPFVDHGVFVHRRVREAWVSITGLPEWATFVGLTSAGVPQIMLGPAAPSTSEFYQLLYFQKPTKPTAPSSVIAPAFPESHEDLIWRRAIWQAAKHPRYRRAEWMEYQQDYYDRLFEAQSRFDGQNEISRQVKGTVPHTSDWDLDNYFRPLVSYLGS